MPAPIPADGCEHRGAQFAAPRAPQTSGRDVRGHAPGRSPITASAAGNAGNTGRERAATMLEPFSPTPTSVSSTVSVLVMVSVAEPPPTVSVPVTLLVTVPPGPQPSAPAEHSRKRTLPPAGTSAGTNTKQAQVQWGGLCGGGKVAADTEMTSVDPAQDPVNSFVEVVFPGPALHATAQHLKHLQQDGEHEAIDRVVKTTLDFMIKQTERSAVQVVPAIERVHYTAEQQHQRLESELKGEQCANAELQSAVHQRDLRIRAHAQISMSLKTELTACGNELWATKQNAINHWTSWKEQEKTGVKLTKTLAQRDRLISTLKADRTASEQAAKRRERTNNKLREQLSSHAQLSMRAEQQHRKNVALQSELDRLRSMMRTDRGQCHAKLHLVQECAVPGGGAHTNELRDVTLEGEAEVCGVGTKLQWAHRKHIFGEDATIHSVAKSLAWLHGGPKMDRDSLTQKMVELNQALLYGKNLSSNSLLKAGMCVLIPDTGCIVEGTVTKYLGYSKDAMGGFSEMWEATDRDGQV